MAGYDSLKRECKTDDVNLTTITDIFLFMYIHMPDDLVGCMNKFLYDAHISILKLSTYLLSMRNTHIIEDSRWKIT